MKIAQDLDQLAINTLRMLAIDAVEKANSGHPGMPMGAAPAAYTLWTKIMNHNGKNPDWFNRDRFILSAGHGSALLYSLLHLSGYDVTKEDLLNFRQLGSRTPGHPEFGHTSGVEATTGPLGQGVAMAVGMALTEKFLSSTFNKEHLDLINHYTYCLCGDGDIMEGVCQEAISLAGHLKLGKLILIYDSNKVSLDGDLNLSYSEQTGQRFQAAGWDVIYVRDGNNTREIEEALLKAITETTKPTLVEVNTTIGYGSPNKGGTSAAHGSALGPEEVELVKQNYDWDYPPFHIPESVQQHFTEQMERGKQAEEKWTALWESYQNLYPEEAKQFKSAMSGRLQTDLGAELPKYEENHPPIATRQASEDILNAISKKIPWMISGSADLASSNKTILTTSSNFSSEDYRGRNIWFGVREHAMGAIMNGMALHGGVRPYGGTFLTFSDYMRPAIRLSALMGTPVIYVFTHDSIHYGEDGPTHQPIEHLPSLRLIPRLTVIRPADANETAAAYQFALKQNNGPVAMILSRHDLPIVKGTKEKAANLANGAYIIQKERKTDPDLVIIATGSEVSLALEVREVLLAKDIDARVISMPSRELFEKQSKSYKEQIIPPQIKKRVSLELAHPANWFNIVGNEGLVLGIDDFGASAPGPKVVEAYGFSTKTVVSKITNYMNDKCEEENN